jgi:lipopolysaccharide transport system permease protein
MRWQTSYKLGMQDIALRYKRSLLGPFWISASLVATVLALAFVFAEVFRQEFAHYIAFLGAGLLAWQLISGLVSEGCSSVVDHSSLLQNVRLPITVIAGRLAFRNAVIFAHNMIAVVVLLLFFGARFSPVALLALPGALAILIFGYFLMMTMGPLCARFRDIPMVVQSGMQVIFFLTPIFWMPSAVSHRPMFTHANPFYHMIELVRAPLLGEPASQLNWLVAAWCCAAAAMLAVLTTSLTRKRLILWL